MSAWQTIHMKYQDLFPIKNKKDNIFQMSCASVMISAFEVRIHVVSVTGLKNLSGTL